MDKKENMEEYYKQYRIDNKEKMKQYRIDNKEKSKQYYIDNEKKIKEQRKQYKINNKEKIIETNKQYYIKNKEKIKEYKKTEKGIKCSHIGDWKIKGLIGNYDEIYDRYFNCNNCEECNCEFSIKGDGVGRWKCMDHDHITGLFRNVLCNTCNIKRR
jgi:hypothetical protein